MKVDFHSHILPGIDDGAKTLEESVQLAMAMGGWGFDRITCTPHITKLYRNTPDSIRLAFNQLQEALSTIENAPGINCLIYSSSSCFSIFSSFVSDTLCFNCIISILANI